MTIVPPDRLTPQTLQTVTFPTARLGKRGVDEDHVRVFCEWVESELTRLLNEKTALEQEVGRLREHARDDPPEEDPQLNALSIMLRAKQTADQYVANAQEFSRDIAADARKRRAEILTESERCRTQLRASLEVLARSIDDWERTEHGR